METTKDPKLLKTFVYLERQQSDNIPEDFNQYKNLSTRHALVFFEETIIVPINFLRLHSASQKPPSYEQNDTSHKALLVSKTDGSHSKEVL